ncbi:MAG: aminoacyl-tRNA hydrolase [Cyanobacteria bacterium RYN_339]|nr:aminoacyl-tRNA hydrolase [Cyanobacteria bacterium RYN_339]
MPDLVVAPGVVIPADALDFSAVRAGGPGGQHVNKVASKVELRVSIERIEGLYPAARERLVGIAGFRLTQDGVLMVTASESRHQFQNRQTAQDKLIELIQRSLVAPVPRRATKPSRASKERRLDGKAKDSAKKRERRSRSDD